VCRAFDTALENSSMGRVSSSEFQMNSVCLYLVRTKVISDADHKVSGL
jgi:hypothetical protein